VQNALHCKMASDAGSSKTFEDGAGETMEKVVLTFRKHLNRRLLSSGL
jgi:hypothetical protein